MSQSPQSQEIGRITRKGGELLEKLAKDPEMRQPMAKNDGSPVTRADWEVSQFLVGELKKFGYPVVSEEDLPKEQPSGTYFLVDPLDGTKYFARGENEYAVCVGLIKDDQPFYGAIYDPIDSRLFHAEVGSGAFVDDQKIKHPGPNEELTVYSSGFHKKDHHRWIVEEMNIGDIREKGSALKFCDMALGEVDFYVRFGPTSEWDTAAAQVILNEADCDLFEVVTLAPMTYGKKDYLNRGTLACHKSLSSRASQLIDERDLQKLSLTLGVRRR